MKRTHFLRISVIAGFCAIAMCAQGEEGFWLHSAPPLAQWRSDYGFKPSAAFLSNLMRSTVRFNSGGNSGSFVSADGLYLTNFHIGKPMVERLQDGKRYTKEGFYALDPDETLRIPNTELRSPESIEDVTVQVRVAASGTDRERVIAQLEAESQKKTGLRSQVVELYDGARYELYRYRIYTDVRLVFIPEEAIGTFDDPGDTVAPEDPDSFNFDICLFRVYDNGKPVKIKHHLKMSLKPVKPGELLIGSGDPGSSIRHAAFPQFEFQRDRVLALQVERDRRVEIALADSIERDAGDAARLMPRLQSARYHRMLNEITFDAFNNPRFMEPKQREYDALVAALPSRAAVDRLSEAQRSLRELYPKYFLLESVAGFNSQAFAYAKALMTLDTDDARVRAKRSEARLSAGRVPDSTLDHIRLGAWFEMLVDKLGYNEIVKDILDRQSPQERAQTLVAETRLLDPEYRKSLLDSAPNSGTEDPMIELARSLSAAAADVRKRFWAQMDIVEEAQAEIATAALTLPNRWQYPDATNTPRLTYGTLKGREEAGRLLAEKSTFGGLYHYVSNQTRRSALVLPPRWRDKQAVLNPNTSLNLITTIDTVGGSSGTPIVNRKGELVGVISGSNRDAAAANYFYSAATMRFIVVSSIAIVEALDKVYGADDLVKELLRGRR